MFENRKQPGLDPDMYDEEDLKQVQQTSQLKTQDEPIAPVQTDSVSNILNRQLIPGERVLWQGRPQTMHRQTAGSFGMLIGVFFLAFSIFWMMGALNAIRSGLLGLIFPLFGIPFVLVGLNMVFPNLLSGRRRKMTQYAITNKRVLEIAGQKVTAWPINTIVSAEKHYWKDGTGDLILSNGQVRYSTNSNGHRTSHAVTLCLMGLPDVDAAEATLYTAKQ